MIRLCWSMEDVVSCSEILRKTVTTSGKLQQKYSDRGRRECRQAHVLEYVMGVAGR